MYNDEHEYVNTMCMIDFDNIKKKINISKNRKKNKIIAFCDFKESE
jgi:hypothetical protein